MFSGVLAKVRPRDPSRGRSPVCHDKRDACLPKFSIIVPVFNEALLIRPFLAHLRERAPGAEIIVADGGSSDGTADLAAAFCDQLVLSECNRAVQMNAGARAAKGDVLWFLHVDAETCRCRNSSRMFESNYTHHRRPNCRRRLLPDSPAARLRLSLDRHFCALRRHSAPNAMRRSRAVLPANCLPGHWRISRSAVDGRRRIFSPAAPSRHYTVHR